MTLSRDRLATEEQVLEALSHNGISCEIDHNKVKEWQQGSLKAIHDNVNHPAHYNNSPAKCDCGRRIECIDVTRHHSFNIGNAIKYLWRCDLKGASIEDLRKAVWYIQDEIKERVKNGS